MATLGQRHQDGQVRGCGKTGTSQAGHGGTSWPNNPLERTGPQRRLFGLFLAFLLWAAVHREH
jgi:hypothetical protein